MTVSASARRAEPWIVAGLILAALVVRLFTYMSLPHNINNDEFEWGWAGQSLLLHGHPSSWSYLAGYPPGGGVMANPVTHALLPWQPRWVDHPPLFSALVGVFALAAGETAPSTVSLSVIRLVPVLCSVACVGLLYLLVRRHLGRPVAAVAAALLAFTPVAVTASALVEAEWLLAVFLLGALLLVGRRDRLGVACLVALCLLAPLVKETGVVVAGSACVMLLLGRRWRLALGVAAAGAVGAGLIAAWGAIVDWPAFVATTQAQFARHATPSNPLAFLMSLVSGYGNRVPFRDPVWYAGLLGVVAALVICAARRRWREAVFIAPVVAMSLLMLVAAPGQVTQWNGWYRLAIYPLVYVGAAWLVVGLATLALRSRTLVMRPRPAGRV
ncbi:MAG TPA: glycosyltransferase family 39 protein [Candidatus Deferrimicrobium sp.]|nr:glycosyltransferase family 39 protein [Candidatus Deferrimicrobium sp.]